MKTIIIDGNSFKNLKGFYEEIENKFTKDLAWKMGRNLDALDDVFYGGYGVFEPEEKIVIKWINADKSKNALGYLETTKYLKKCLKICHHSSKNSILKKLKESKAHQGPTLFDTIIKIIIEHNYIKLVLEE